MQQSILAHGEDFMSAKATSKTPNHTSPCRDLVKLKTIVHMLSNDIQHKFNSIDDKLTDMSDCQNRVEKKIIEILTKEKVRKELSAHWKWKLATIIGVILSIIGWIIAFMR